MALRGVEDSETAEAAALLRVAMLIARAAPPGELFATAAAQAAGLLGVEAGAVVRFIGQERGVVVGVWRPDGIRAMPVNAELDFPRSGTALGQVCATGRAARVEAYEPARGGISAVMQAIGLRTTAAAPIPAGD